MKSSHKHYLLSLVSLTFFLSYSLFFQSCASKKGGNSISNQYRKDTIITKPNNLSVNKEGLDINQFLSGFEAAVLHYDVQKVLTYMDSSYKREQHDSFCRMDSKKFLNEFFSNGEYVNKTDPIVYFSEIKTLKRGDIKLSPEKLIYVNYEVSSSDKTIYVMWTVIPRMSANGSVSMGLSGKIN